MTDPVFTALVTEDALAAVEMRKARLNRVHEKGEGKRIICYFHENPHESFLPVGRDLRDALRDVEPEEYDAEAHSSAPAEKPKAAKKGKATGSKKAPAKKAGKK